MRSRTARSSTTGASDEGQSCGRSTAPSTPTPPPELLRCLTRGRDKAVIEPPRLKAEGWEGEENVIAVREKGYVWVRLWGQLRGTRGNLRLNKYITDSPSLCVVLARALLEEFRFPRSGLHRLLQRASVGANSSQH